MPKAKTTGRPSKDAEDVVGHRLNLLFTEEVVRLLDERAKRFGLSRSDVIRQIVRKDLGLDHFDFGGKDA